MPMNLVQFRSGLSMPEFQRRYGNEAKRRHTLRGEGSGLAFCVRPARSSADRRVVKAEVRADFRRVYAPLATPLRSRRHDRPLPGRLGVGR
jgi:hypothetical protein